MDSQQLISELVGASYDSTIHMEKRLRRNWLVRTVDPLPNQGTLSKMQAALEEVVFASIGQAYSAVSTPEALAGVRPSILLVRLREFHLLVRIECADHENTIGDAISIAQWGTLQRLDKEIEFDDLQGLPWDCWFQLRAARLERERGVGQE